MTRLTLIPVLALGLVLASCGTKEAATPPPPPEVGIITLKKEAVQLTTELPGRTAPYLIAEVRPQVTGLIERRLFTEGSMVKKGQQLYQVDAAPYQAAYDQAKANLSRAAANLKAVSAQAKRAAELVKVDAVSQQEADDAAAGLGQAQADVAAARAALETARINLGYTRLAAPISGRIGRSTVTPGALVNANQTMPLATIQTLDPIYVDVTQSSNEMLEIRQALLNGALSTDREASAQVRLTLQDGTEYPLAGRLRFTEVSVDPSSGSVVLRAEFPNPQGLLLPGMYVRATLVEAVNQAAILVPQKAVTRDASGSATAFVVAAEDKVEARKIEASRAIGNRWMVTSGLQEGDRLIVDGLQRFTAGGAVTPVPAEPKTEKN